MKTGMLLSLAPVLAAAMTRCVLAEAKLANGKMSVAPKSGALDPAAPEWRRHTFVFAPQYHSVG